MNIQPPRAANNQHRFYGLQQGTGASRPQIKHRGKEVAVLGPITCESDSEDTQNRVLINEFRERALRRRWISDNLFGTIHLTIFTEGGGAMGKHTVLLLLHRYHEHKPQSATSGKKPT